jgi:hypothetical protein
MRYELTDKEGAPRAVAAEHAAGAPRVDERPVFNGIFSACARVRFPSQMRNKNQKLAGLRARRY